MMGLVPLEEEGKRTLSFHLVRMGEEGSHLQDVQEEVLYQNLTLLVPSS